MTRLEDEYRAALRWYPRAWRQQHGDALVGTLLDAAEAEGRDEATASERRDLRLNGVRARGLAFLPIGIADRAASLALGIGGAFATLQFVGIEWAPWTPTAAHHAQWTLPVPAEAEFGPFVSVGAVFYLIWIAAFVTGMLGWRWVTRTVLGLTLVASIVMALLPVTPATLARPPLTGMLAMALLAGVALLGTPGRSARSAGWLAITFAVATAAICGTFWIRFPTTHFPQPGAWGTRQFFTALPAPWIALGLAAAIVLALIARRRNWAIALFVGLTPWWLGMIVNSTSGDPSEQLMVLPYALAFVAVLIIRGLGLRLVRKDGSVAS
jgi:hypothetical protein